MNGKNTTEPSGEQRPFDICQRTFQFALEVVSLCAKLRQHGGAAFELSRQLIRSGTSIGANVEEGQAAQSRADFISKYSIARKEARETSYWLRLLSASEICSLPKLDTQICESQELIKMLTTIIMNAKGE
jgi:four helix bundle protein